MPVSSPWPRIVDLSHAQALFEQMAEETTEIAAFAYLDPDGRLLGMRHMPGDQIDMVEVPVRQIVADALAFDAAGVVMAHNHPSGDPRPSQADRATTRRLLVALDPIDVRLVDHLVLARGGSASFRAMGLL